MARIVELCSVQPSRHGLPAPSEAMEFRFRCGQYISNCNRWYWVERGEIMAKRNEPYRYCIVESYYPDSTAGLHGPIHIRPVPGEEFPTHLHVECSKDLVNPRIYPVGTRFRLRVKLTDRQGGGEFLYSYFGWPVEVVE